MSWHHVHSCACVHHESHWLLQRCPVRRPSSVGDCMLLLQWSPVFVIIAKLYDTLHRLPVLQWTLFKVAVLAYDCVRSHWRFYKFYWRCPCALELALDCDLPITDSAVSVLQHQTTFRLNWGTVTLAESVSNRMSPEVIDFWMCLFVTGVSENLA